jgi:hypothetical protein
MRCILAMALLLFSYISGLGQQSKTSPGYSLSRLDPEQCSYAIAIINQVTRNIEASENGTLTEQNSTFPRPVQNVDTYVESKVRSLKFAPVEFNGARLSDLSKPSVHAAKSAKLKISLQQRDFAYVLELRGCALQPSSVSFVKGDDR